MSEKGFEFISILNNSVAVSVSLSPCSTSAHADIFDRSCDGSRKVIMVIVLLVDLLDAELQQNCEGVASSLTLICMWVLEPYC